MAFIRAYMEQGDPWKLRLPRGLRKLTLRKALAAGAGFIPGIGGIAAQLAAGGGGGGSCDCTPEVQEYARSLGIDMGDPFKGAPGNSGRRGVPPRPRSGAQPKGAGPATRVSGRPGPTGQHGAPAGHSTRGTTSARPHPTHGGSTAGPSMGGGLSAAAKDRLAGVLQQARGGNLGGMLGTAILGTGAQGAAAHLAGLGGGHRKTMNPANVRALRRSLRRVEGFEKLVKRIEKAFPRMRGMHHSKASSCGCSSKRRGK